MIPNNVNSSPSWSECTDVPRSSQESSPVSPGEYREEDWLAKILSENRELRHQAEAAKLREKYLHEELTAHEIRLTNQKNSLKVHKDIFQQLRREQAALMEQVQQSNARQESLEMQLQNSEQELQRSDAMQTDLRQKLSEAEERCKMQEERAAAAVAAAAADRQQAELQQAGIKEMEAMLAWDMAAWQQQVADLKSQLEAQMQALASAKAEIDSLKAKLAASSASTSCQASLANSRAKTPDIHIRAKAFLKKSRVMDEAEQELQKMRLLPLDSRKAALRSLSAKWHPDKHPGFEMEAKQIFQYIQGRKAFLMELPSPSAGELQG